MAWGDEWLGWGTDNGNYSFWLEEGGQTANELNGKKFDGFSASCEDVVDDVIVLGGFRDLRALHKSASVFDSGDVVRRQAEVLASELVHDGVNLHDRGFDTVVDQRSGERANTESTGCH